MSLNSSLNQNAQQTGRYRFRDSCVKPSLRKRQRAYMFHRMRSPIRCSNCSIDIRKPFFRMKLRCSCLERGRAPLTPTITLPQSSGTARLKNEDVTVRKVADNRFTIGLASAITMFGHTVRVYDLERTICDLFRSRSTVDPQDLQSAFQNYMRSAHTDLVKLMNYAREFRLVNVMRPYLEAVMPAWFTGEFIL